MKQTTLMMKLIRGLVLISAAILGATAALAQNAAKLMQAELLRSTTGRGIDSFGFASLSVPLKKGALYDVVRQENGNVVLTIDGKQVVVPTGAVALTEKLLASVTSNTGFVPGKIVLVSAKYSLDGNPPRNVKNALQKLIPQTIVTEPVQIIVTDALSSAAQDQGNQTQGTVIITPDMRVNVVIRTPTKNVLTVEYLFNGKSFTKQVPEGEKLVLP
ncbi:MAG: hypothetical protein NTY98_03915 [Verrucomicrobia bacterium]|nr:hypothetical protein [Verrucomicrobiota bacterium]